MTTDVAIRAYDLALGQLKSSDRAAVNYALKRLQTYAMRAKRRASGKDKRARLRRAGIMPVKTLVAKADEAFSVFVRNRDTSTDGESRWGHCVTCGGVFPRSGLDCGHCIRRENWGTRWEEKNAHAQCRSCNYSKGGHETIHRQRVDQIHGPGTMGALDLKAQLNKRKPKRFELVLLVHNLYNRLDDEGKQALGWGLENVK
jgi:hypothetical protein